MIQLQYNTCTVREIKRLNNLEVVNGTAEEEVRQIGKKLARYDTRQCLSCVCIVRLTSVVKYDRMRVTHAYTHEWACCLECRPVKVESRNCGVI